MRVFAPKQKGRNCHLAIERTEAHLNLDLDITVSPSSTIYNTRFGMFWRFGGSHWGEEEDNALLLLERAHELGNFFRLLAKTQASQPTADAHPHTQGECEERLKHLLSLPNSDIEEKPFPRQGRTKRSITDADILHAFGVLRIPQLVIEDRNHLNAARDQFTPNDVVSDQRSRKRRRAATSRPNDPRKPSDISPQPPSPGDLGHGYLGKSGPTTFPFKDQPLCCGIKLDSLRDLLQHYEEVHADKSPTSFRRPAQPYPSFGFSIGDALPAGKVAVIQQQAQLQQQQNHDTSIVGPKSFVNISEPQISMKKAAFHSSFFDTSSHTPKLFITNTISQDCTGGEDANCASLLIALKERPRGFKSRNAQPSNGIKKRRHL